MRQPDDVATPLAELMWHMPNSLGVFLTCDTKATTTATATATATPAALSQLLLLLLLLERWESTALETDKAHWVWGIKNESGRK